MGTKSDILSRLLKEGHITMEEWTILANPGSIVYIPVYYPQPAPSPIPPPPFSLPWWEMPITVCNKNNDYGGM